MSRAPAAERAVALVRVAALPVILVGEQLVSHPELGGEVFDWLLAAGSCYAVLTLVAASGGGARGCRTGSTRRSTSRC